MPEVIAVGDEEFQRRCFEHLYKLRRDGVTIVLVSHGSAVIEAMCDRVVWLDHGVVQAEVASEHRRAAELVGFARDVAHDSPRFAHQQQTGCPVHTPVTLPAVAVHPPVTVTKSHALMMP